MSGNFDEMFASAIAQGERNAEAIPLIKAHCVHARVELSAVHGHAPLEDMTGLPISVREMRCQYAPAPASVGSDLLGGAIEFYEHNCIGCAHRAVQRLPNLKTVAEEVIAERDRKRAAQDAGAAAAAAERTQRAAARAQRVAGEPVGTRGLIALLDTAVDAEQPDRERGRELADLCRLQPELCTPAAAEVLLELAATHPTEELFEALGYLDAARKLDRDGLLAAAVAALTKLPVVAASRLVGELHEGLPPGVLRPTLRSIIYVAAPAAIFPGRTPVGDAGAFRAAATTDLAGLLDELQELLGAQEEYPRRVGARGAALLIEIEPSVIPVLVRPLIDALLLPDSMSGFFGSPRGEISEGLNAALRCDPDATTPVLEARGRSGDDDLRTVLFDVYESALHDGRRGGEFSEPAAAAALDAAFRRIEGDWGEQIAAGGATLIAYAAKHQPALMASRVDQLFGALVIRVSARREPGLGSALPAGAPPVLAAMEESIRRNMDAVVIRELRKALGEMVKHEPDAVARNVMSIIEAPELESEEAKDLRDEAVQLLGDLGQRVELLPDVLPALWSALLHGEQRVRARAVEAWEKIAVRGHRLPRELDELLPVLLADSYVIVHRATIRALRNGLPVADAQLSDVVESLLRWAHTYAGGDSDLLDDLLQVTWSLAGRLPTQVADVLREQCLQLAQSLDAYDKERFLNWQARGSEALPSFPARLLEVAANRRVDRTNQRDDGVLRQLRGLDGVRLASLGEEIASAARAHLPDNHWEAQRFIEILQRAGLWTLALELAQEIRDTIPDDQEHAVERRGTEALAELVAAEDMLAHGEPGEAESALERSQRANDAQRSEIERRPRPWETE